MPICPYCEGEVSETARKCRHCGEWIARRTGGEEDDGSSFRGVGHRVKEATSRAAADAKRVLPEWASRARDALPNVKDIPTHTIERLIQDRDLEVFLLPTGSDQQAFTCAVDLTDTLEALSSGVLVRPRLVVWTHRSDLDRDRLAIMLEEQFADQVAAFRASQVAEHERTAQRGINRAERERKDAKRIGRTSKKALLAAMLGMALVTNPLLDLVLLVVAVTAGAGAFVEGLREVEAGVGLRFSRSRHEAGTKKGVKAAEAKKRAFRAALKRWKVRVHPQLFTLASDFALLDDVPGPYAEEVENAGPTVTGLLRGGDYLGVLPDCYYPLLERRLEVWR